MTMKTINESRHEVLNKILAELEEQMLAAQLSDAQDEESVEVLRVVFDEMGFDSEDGAIGEFFFMPVGGEEDSVQHFVASVTVADDIKEENKGKLYEALAIINNYLPCGAFVLDGKRSILSYRLTVPLPMGLSADQLYEEVNIVMGNAVAITDQYTDLLLKVNFDGMEVDEVLEALGI